MRNVRPGSGFINTIFHICQFQYTHKIVSELLNHTPTKYNFLTRVYCVFVCVSCSVVSKSLQPHGLQPTRLLCPWDSPGKSTGVGNHSLLQGTFLTQESNPSLPHCRQILYHLSHQGSPYFVFTLQYFPQFLILVLDLHFFHCGICYSFVMQSGLLAGICSKFLAPITSRLVENVCLFQGI